MSVLECGPCDCLNKYTRDDFMFRAGVLDTMCSILTAIENGGAPPVTSVTEAEVSITDAGQLVLAANAGRRGGSLRVNFDSPSYVHVSLTGVAATTSSPSYGPGDVIPLNQGGVITTAIYAITPTGATATIQYTELE